MALLVVVLRAEVLLVGVTGGGGGAGVVGVGVCGVAGVVVGGGVVAEVRVTQLLLVSSVATVLLLTSRVVP